MDKTVLVTADLAPDLIEHGRTLVRALDAEAVPFDAAFWLLDEDSGLWHLVLGKPAVRLSGSTALYKKVDKTLMKLGFHDRLWIGMVSIVDLGSPTVRALRAKLGSARSVDGARLDNVIVNGVRMPACLLYRVSAKQKLIPQVGGASEMGRPLSATKAARSH